VETIIRSIEKNGVLEGHAWLVCRLHEAEGEYTLRGIDCGHKLAAYKQLNIEEARAMVFPPLDEDEYRLIAGKLLLSNK
jgi:hypothetical protein